VNSDEFTVILKTRVWYRNREQARIAALAMKSAQTHIRAREDRDELIVKMCRSSSADLQGYL
jgi:hypothetical protein